MARAQADLAERAKRAIALDADADLLALTRLGLDPDSADASGAPLLFHCAQGSSNCLSLLLSLGADPSLACPDGTTAAMRAARCCPICLGLLQSLPGAWDARDSGGRGALHHAAMGASQESSHSRAALLLACDRAPDACFSRLTCEGKTPLALACERANPVAALALLSRSDPLDCEAAAAAIAKSPQMARALERLLACAERRLLEAWCPSAPPSADGAPRRL